MTLAQRLLAATAVLTVAITVVLGFAVLPPFKSFAIGVGPQDDAYRVMLDGYKAGLRDHLAALDRLEPLKFNGWSDWDEHGRLKPGAPSYGPFMRHAD